MPTQRASCDLEKSVLFQLIGVAIVGLAIQVLVHEGQVAFNEGQIVASVICFPTLKILLSRYVLYIYI